MKELNPITICYLKLLEGFAIFLVWFAEALESLFGPGVRNGVWGPSSHRSDVVKELDQTNPFPQTADVFETDVGEDSSSPSPRPQGLFSSPQMPDMAFPCQTENIGGFPDSTSDGTTDPKAFNPYDPEEPLSIYNGDPLSFDPNCHPNPFDTNN